MSTSESHKLMPENEPQLEVAGVEASLSPERESVMRMFQSRVQGMIDAGNNTHLKQIKDFSVSALTWDDCEMYLRVEGMSAFGPLPTEKEFRTYQDPILKTTDVSRRGFSAYLANVLSHEIGQRFLRSQE